VGTDGLLTDDMGRALGLDRRQTTAINEALASFGARYRELEVAHWHPTDEHPTSMHISPIADQKTFICDAFPEDYDRLMAELKSTLDQTMGRENSEYFWANTAWTGHEELDPDRGPVAKRITLFRPSKEEPGGGPYYLGEEYQFKNGNWGSAHFGPLQEDSRIEFPMVKQVIADWKRSAATR
jgi:hypothetical protein